MSSASSDQAGGKSFEYLHCKEGLQALIDDLHDHEKHLEELNTTCSVHGHALSCVTLVVQCLEKEETEAVAQVERVKDALEKARAAVQDLEKEEPEAVAQVERVKDKVEKARADYEALNQKQQEDKEIIVDKKRTIDELRKKVEHKEDKLDQLRIAEQLSGYPCPIIPLCDRLLDDVREHTIKQLRIEQGEKETLEPHSTRPKFMSAVDEQELKIKSWTWGSIWRGRGGNKVNGFQHKRYPWKVQRFVVHIDTGNCTDYTIISKAAFDYLGLANLCPRKGKQNIQGVGTSESIECELYQIQFTVDDLNMESKNIHATVAVMEEKCQPGQIGHYDLLLNAQAAKLLLDLPIPGFKQSFDIIPKAPAHLYGGEPCNTVPVSIHSAQQYDSSKTQSGAPITSTSSGFECRRARPDGPTGSPCKRCRTK
jgi:hypothetical protein